MNSSFKNPLNSLGIMPVVKTDAKWDEIYEKVFEIFKEINVTQPTSFRDNEGVNGLRCFTGFGMVLDFWMGMQRNSGSERWRSVYDPSVDLKDINLEVSSKKHNCVYNLGGKPISDRQVGVLQ